MDAIFLVVVRCPSERQLDGAGTRLLAAEGVAMMASYPGVGPPLRGQMWKMNCKSRISTSSIHVLDSSLAEWVVMMNLRRVIEVARLGDASCATLCGGQDHRLSRDPHQIAGLLRNADDCREDNISVSDVANSFLFEQ